MKLDKTYENANLPKFLKFTLQYKLAESVQVVHHFQFRIKTADSNFKYFTSLLGPTHSEGTFLFMCGVDKRI